MHEGEVVWFHQSNERGEIKDNEGKVFTLNTKKSFTGIDASQLGARCTVRFEIGEKDRSGRHFAKNVEVIAPPPPAEEAPTASVPDKPMEKSEPPTSDLRPVNRDRPKQKIIKPPYHFVPIPTHSGTVRAITDIPIFHHGSNSEQAKLLSGELQCELEALTPLLVGNDQYPFASLADRDQLEKWLSRIQKELKEEDRIVPGPKKAVIEPLRLDDGRVVISGASLKGMLRQSIGALLAAPMERVAERSYSYRPNVAGDRDGIRKPLPAIVIDPPEEDGKKMRVKLLMPPDNVRGPWFPDGAFGSKRPNGPKKGRAPRNPREYRYLGGLDGTGDLHELAKRNHTENSGVGKKNKFRTKHRAVLSMRRNRNGALVPAWEWDQRPTPVRVPQKVVWHYWESLRHLADSDYGHLCERHPLNKRSSDNSPGNQSESEGARESNCGGDSDNGSSQELEIIRDRIAELREKALQKDHLIYVEWDSDSNVVTAIGHNYQHRLCYADTVRKQWKDWTGKPLDCFNRETRGILKPLTEEQQHIPKALSGARLLFGYAAEDSDHSGTGGIGKGNFKRLAGRIAFNMAVEHRDGDWESNDDNPSNFKRFLNQHNGCFVPLKELGMPRPSAVEFYLQQRKESVREDGAEDLLTTYGDLPDPDHPGGELNGRKFYLHQPDAADAYECYEDRTKEGIESERASLARYVSAPKTRFRFTLRFRDLREWELGTVLAALDPDNVTRIQGLPPDVQYCLDGATKKSSGERFFALKLGHGRPLGMGSVKISVDSVRLWNTEGLEDLAYDQRQEIIDRAINALWAKLKVGDTGVLLQWLKVHKYVARTRSEYPAEQGEIYTWHTERRKAHAKARRSHGTQGRNRHVLQDLECLNE